MATTYVSCPYCHSQNPANYQTCSNCGTMLPISPMPMQPVAAGQKLPGAEKKLAAGICGILVGSFGVHKFILGYQTEGVIMLTAWLLGLFLTCGVVSLVINVIAIIEGVIYLTKSDEEFVQTYVLNKKPWF